MNKNSVPVKIIQQQKVEESIDEMTFIGQASFMKIKGKVSVMLSLDSPTGYHSYAEIREISNDELYISFCQKDSAMLLKKDCLVTYDYPFENGFLPLEVLLIEKQLDLKRMVIKYHFLLDNRRIENILKVEVL